MGTVAPTQELEALEEGRAFADLSSYRKVRVTGSDARSWLNDLVTADVATLEPGGAARRSLLLTPTGRIRAYLSIARDDEFLLLQAPDQPEHVALLLSPYVLNSDVSLHDATDELALIAVPVRAASVVGQPGRAPSVLGSGVDLLTPVGEAARRVSDMLVKHDLVEAGEAALEIWRIRHGAPRMGVDFGQDAFAAEVGLEAAIDFTKGCFLGQESVARVRNLGHPPRSFVHVRADQEVPVGTPVTSEAAVVGEITSVAPGPEWGWMAIARIRWEFADSPLSAGGGTHLSRIGRTD
jgi:folate-binding protein YgfZ